MVNQLTNALLHLPWRMVCILYIIYPSYQAQLQLPSAFAFSHKIAPPASLTINNMTYHSVIVYSWPFNVCIADALYIL